MTGNTPGADIMATTTVSLAEAAEEYRTERLPDLEADRDQLAADAADIRARLDALREDDADGAVRDADRDADGDGDTDLEETLVAEYEALRAAFQETEKAIKETRRHIEVFKTCNERWGRGEDAKFTIRTNFSWEGLSQLTDRIDQHRDDDGSAPQGVVQTLTLEHGIEALPANCPQVRDDEFPWQVGEWLYERIDAANTYGETSMGNSSFEEAVEEQLTEREATAVATAETEAIEERASTARSSATPSRSRGQTLDSPEEQELEQEPKDSPRE